MEETTKRVDNEINKFFSNPMGTTVGKHGQAQGTFWLLLQTGFLNVSLVSSQYFPLKN